MKIDIPFLPVEGIQVVVARKLTEINQPKWQVFLINQNEQPIHTVFVTARGYGEKGGEEQKTATLRHFFVSIEPNAHELIEPIMPDVFHLNNEYWVSYYVNSQIYDKKFIRSGGPVCARQHHRATPGQRTCAWAGEHFTRIKC